MTPTPLQLRKAKLEQDLEQALKTLRGCSRIHLDDYIIKAAARQPLYVARSMNPPDKRNPSRPIDDYSSDKSDKSDGSDMSD